VLLSVGKSVLNKVSLMDSLPSSPSFHPESPDCIKLCLKARGLEIPKGRIGNCKGKGGGKRGDLSK
jgi:hypothetical protein